MSAQSDKSMLRSRADLARAARVVVKVGSAVVAPGGELDRTRVAGLAADIAGIAAPPVPGATSREVILVSSGAVASGFRDLGLTARPRTIVQKQAAAAVGQQRLMHAYAEAFAGHRRTIGQVLLTADDLDHRRRFLNARRTLEELLSHGIIPVINENDSVSFDEIKLGDNDRLSALVASLVRADALLILSSVDGVLARDGGVVSLVDRPEDALAHVRTGTSETGVGGMDTKVGAARTAGAAGMPVVIAGGHPPGNLPRILAGEDVGTFFVPRARAAASRKRWIGYSARPRGTIIVDDGARAAVVERGASLLPSGVAGIEGDFEAGSPVEIRSVNGKTFARGIASYSAVEIRRIRGKRAAEIEQILGYSYAEEVVHRNDLSLVE